MLDAGLGIVLASLARAQKKASTSVLEAAANELSIVASDTSGIRKKIRDLMLSMAVNAYELSRECFIGMLEETPSARVLDLGCGFGDRTLSFAKKIGTEDIYGVEVIEERVECAKKRGIKCCKANLNDSLPFDNEFFDVVLANQVIEHLYDLDLFIREIWRVLKTRGYVVLSTENLSSWHNLFALLLGYQAFSQHISRKAYLGVPSPRRGQPIEEGYPIHNKILTYHGLRDLFEFYGFKVEKIQGAAYHPFCFSKILVLSKALSKLDPIHASFILLKVRKQG